LDKGDDFTFEITYDYYSPTVYEKDGGNPPTNINPATYNATPFNSLVGTGYH